jgi:DNA-binding protein Fis
MAKNKSPETATTPLEDAVAYAAVLVLDNLDGDKTFKEVVYAIEKNMIEVCLSQHGGSITPTALALNMNRTTLTEKCRALGVKVVKKSGPERTPPLKSKEFQVDIKKRGAKPLIKIPDWLLKPQKD